jgi:hypothetical protein
VIDEYLHNWNKFFLNFATDLVVQQAFVGGGMLILLFFSFIYICVLLGCYRTCNKIWFAFVVLFSAANFGTLAVFV